MITGDHPKTASVIAMNLGIAGEDRPITGADLERATDDALAQMVKDVSVYARVNPEHKPRIVQALQRQGAIVAMTGDGVNDVSSVCRTRVVVLCCRCWRLSSYGSIW